VGWYRLKVDLPRDVASRTVLLRFDGVYMNAQVWVNGQRAGAHAYGYTSFTLDVSDKVKPSANIIAVRVNNEQPSSRWYSGSGILRPAFLDILDPVHVTADGPTITTPQVLVLGIGTTLGIVVQASGLIPALRRVQFRWRWRFDFGKLGLRQIGHTSAWMLVYVIMTQIGLTVILRLSQGAASRSSVLHAAPGPAIFNNAFLIFMMAHGIVAVSILTALMPRLARAAAESRFADMGHNLTMGTRLSAVILIPVTAAYIVLGRPLAVVLFQWGNYTHTEAMQTGTVIAVAAIGLVPYAITQMQLFAFYAMPDTKTPALVNLPVVGVRIALDVILYFALPLALVDAGLMLGNAISYVLAAVIGYQLLRRRIGLRAIGDTMRALGKLAVAALIAAIPAWLLSLLIQHELGNGKGGAIAALIVGAIVLGLAYVGAGLLLKARDITDVAGMVRAPSARDRHRGTQMKNPQGE